MIKITGKVMEGITVKKYHKSIKLNKKNLKMNELNIKIEY